MEKIITHENLRSFAYVNEKICARPIRGICLEFFGLGGSSMYDEETERGRLLAAEGILLVVPYTNPWAWMNRQTVDLADEIVEVLMNHYDLPETLPVISTGGSMGGLSALVYTRYARHTPAACVANCPVCDLPYHFTERPDLPRTLYSAFGGYEGTMTEALQSASPLHLAETMPRQTKYTLFHCTADQAVNKEMHSDRFVAAMGDVCPVEYLAVPDRGHCQLTEEMWALYHRRIIDAVR